MLLAVEARERPAADVVACGGPEVRQRSWRQLVVPSVLRNEILQELHAGALEGHLGEDKTIAKIQE